jgi:hypothetical protein
MLLGLVPGVSRRGPKPLASKLVGHMAKKGVGCDEELVDRGLNAARFVGWPLLVVSFFGAGLCFARSGASAILGFN